MNSITWEEIAGCPQESRVSLVAPMVNNLPSMWATWVQSLDWKDPLEEGMATHSSILTRARTRSPSPRAWRPDFPGAAREAPCNFMAAVTICSDFGAPQKIKSVTVSPSICHEVMGLDAMILVF